MNSRLLQTPLCALDAGINTICRINVTNPLALRQSMLIYLNCIPRRSRACAELSVTSDRRR